MTFKEKVLKLLSEGLQEKDYLFLVDLTITDAMKVIVILDGDGGIVLQDCIDISRSIENNLDREEQDFSLEVASFGVGTPLKLVRQYINNIGRMLIIDVENETFEAKLTHANEEFITISWIAREPKKIGKGKETVNKVQEIPYRDIKQAVVTVTF